MRPRASWKRPRRDRRNPTPLRLVRPRHQHVWTLQGTCLKSTCTAIESLTVADFENEIHDLADILRIGATDADITPRVADIYRTAGAQMRAIRTPAQALDYADDLDLQSDGPDVDEDTARMLARIAGDLRATVRPAHDMTEDVPA